MTSAAIPQFRSTTRRDSKEPNRIRAYSGKHWLRQAGHCSLCNRDEAGRRGARVGVVIRADGQPGRHWICPECARQIARVAP